MSDLKVLAVASEAFPLVKTGGLADVVGALPGALVSHGVAVTTVIPGYPAVMAALTGGSEIGAFAHYYGGPTRLIRGSAGGLDVIVVDAPHLYDRPGNPYLGPNGSDWPDNPIRFAALAQAGAQVASGAIGGTAFDLLHAHDWQAAMAPAYLAHQPGHRPRSVITVHNLAFQGQYPADLFPSLGLPASAFAVDGVEYYGMVGYLKAGLHYADRITTVSPTYAREIMTAEGGMGLDGLIRARASVVSGIVNGIDADIWNPATDTTLAKTYDDKRLKARTTNRAALHESFGLTLDEGLLFCVVSRLTWQKGMDLLAEALPTLLSTGGKLALLGSGDQALEGAFLAAARAHPGRVAVRIGYDEALSHRMMAGADAILVPSRFEPCGLTQLYGLRYGCVPVVARVGGLADTIIDANDAALEAGVATGLQFSPVTREALEAAIVRASQLHADTATWTRLIKRGMTSDLSWQRRAKAYADLFHSLS
jgi:starch synthase